MQGNYIGRLYECSKESDILEPIRKISFIKNIKNESPGWYSFNIERNEPLIKADEELKPPYIYPFLLRITKTKKRFLVLSAHDELIAVFLKWIGYYKYVKLAQVKVHDLVQKLTEKPDKYSLGIVYAWVDGYGQSLRSISLYGTDLSDAQLFRDILPKLSPYRTQLRDVKKGTEVLKVSSKGEVGIYYHDHRTLSEVDAVLSFLTDHGFLVWD